MAPVEYALETFVAILSNSCCNLFLTATLWTSYIISNLRAVTILFPHPPHGAYLTLNKTDSTKRREPRPRIATGPTEMVLDPAPHSQENSESPAIFIFVCLHDVPEKANLSSFLD